MSYKPTIVRLVALAVLVALAPGRLTSAADPPAPSTPAAPSTHAKPAARPAPASPQLSLPPAAVAMLDEMPVFQPGLWEYRRTVLSARAPAGEPDAVKKCSDPSSEIREKMTEMTGKGCRILDMKHLGNRFRSRWSCMMDEGMLDISNVIRAEGPTHYEDENESRYSDKMTHTVVVAKRIGDCPSAESSVPPPPRYLARPSRPHP